LVEQDCEKVMKNNLIYHLVPNATFILILYPWLEGYLSTGQFVIAAFIYSFIYHPIIDYYRLRALGKISEKDFKKMWKWGTIYRFKYYNQLMFGK